jgi:hypothetical protein
MIETLRRFGWSRYGLTYYDPKTKTTRAGLRVILAHWLLAGLSHEVAHLRGEIDGVRAGVRGARLELIEARIAAQRLSDRAESRPVN